MGTIGREIRQTKPFGSAADEAVVTLLGTADRVRTALASVVEAQGITLQQYNVLRILRGAGPDGLPTLDIAGRMIEHSPGITRLLDRLEAQRLVRRVRCPQDRRQILCHASPGALRLLAELERPMAEAGRRMIAPLDAAQTAELVRLLDAVRASAGSPAVPDPDPAKETEKQRNKETSR
jgi:DNA-binding MarR family transcriptional regulator